MQWGSTKAAEYLENLEYEGLLHQLFHAIDAPWKWQLLVSQKLAQKIEHDQIFDYVEQGLLHLQPTSLNIRRP